ncbi:MAG: NAD-binding protein [Candidatus Thalassarchaeaceae archaeon]|jgi:trk system potassium uptake protein TrkA|nr:NAD-binding protein [Candidatus Thalassarchaeaceae archaeon]MEE2629256.1 NAD-binding protein [Candidatus Thermoplasmatota archaeon]
MRVIIAGAGEVGRGVAAALRGERRGVALIDPDPNAISESQSLDCLLVTGSALSRESLIRAGISDAEIIVFATNDDHVNILGCAFAKRVYSEKVADRTASGLITIANIRDSRIIDPTRGAGPLQNWARTNFEVSPSKEVVNQLISGLVAPSLADIIPLGENAWIVQSTVTSASPIVGMTADESTEAGIDDPDYPRIIAIKGRGGKGRIVSGSEIIQEGDMLVFVTGSTKFFGEIARFVGDSSSDMPEKPSVAIFGATDFGSSLASYYLEMGSSVVIIEPDLDAANSIVGSRIGINKRLDVIHGDPQDEDLLRELAIEDHDIAIATLGDDNLNISISMRAFDKGVSRTGLILKDRALVEAIQRIGLRPVSKRRVAIKSVLKAIHMHVPGLYEPIPRIPSLVTMTAEISAEGSLLGKEIHQVQSTIDAHLVMVERPDSSGEMSAIPDSEVGPLQSGDRIYLVLEIDDVGDVENSLRS